MRSAHRVVVMSDDQRTECSAIARRVAVMANAVIPSRGLPDALPEFVQALERPRLAVIGRLSSEKGVDVFLGAAARLAERGLGFSALIVGDGPEREALERLCARLKLTHRVRFLGNMRDVRQIYECVDLVVIPSRSEGLPNVLLEALAHDRPVAATRVGAIPSVIDSPLAGSLAEPGSPDALADAILAALSLRTDSRAADARRRAAARFSLADRVLAHQRLYEAVGVAASS